MVVQPPEPSRVASGSRLATPWRSRAGARPDQPGVRLFWCPSARSRPGPSGRDEEVVRHPPLVPVDRPPDVPIYITRKVRVDRNDRPIFETGHQFRAEPRCQPNVGAAPRHVDMILTASHRAEAALLGTDNRLRILPAARRDQ